MLLAVIGHQLFDFVSERPVVLGTMLHAVFLQSAGVVIVANVAVSRFRNLELVPCEVSRFVAPILGVRLRRWRGVVVPYMAG